MDMKIWIKLLICFLSVGIIIGTPLIFKFTPEKYESIIKNTIVGLVALFLLICFFGRLYDLLGDDSKLK